MLYKSICVRSLNWPRLLLRLPQIYMHVALVSLPLKLLHDNDTKVAKVHVSFHILRGAYTTIPLFSYRPSKLKCRSRKTAIIIHSSLVMSIAWIDMYASVGGEHRATKGWAPKMRAGKATMTADRASAIIAGRTYLLALNTPALFHNQFFSDVWVSSRKFAGGSHRESLCQIRL